MAGHVFISHAHQDRPSAEQLLAALESRGIKCWSVPRDVPPGGSYAESILRGIENSSCFVLVFTQHSNLSPHVLREVERALTLGINIIPVRFDDSGVSKSLDYLLATVHWLSVTAEPRTTAFQHAVEQIASCLDTAAPSPPGPAPPAPLSFSSAPPKPAAPGSRQQLLLWTCLGILAVAVAVLAFLLSRNSTRSPVVTANVSPNATAAAMSSPVAVLPNDVLTSPASGASPKSLETTVKTKAVIRDPDGYSNVREVASLQARVIATARDGETVDVLGQERDWVKVGLATGTVGYVHESRVRMNR